MEYTMKKKIFFTIFLLAAVLAFTEELTGFMGIDFGTTKAEAAKIIEAKGYTLIKDEKVNSTYLNLTGVCFGLPAPIIILSYSKNNLFAGGTFIVELNEDTQEDVWNTFKSLQKIFNIEKGWNEDDGNRAVLYRIAPNKNRLILTCYHGKEYVRQDDFTCLVYTDSKKYETLLSSEKKAIEKDKKERSDAAEKKATMQKSYF